MKNCGTSLPVISITALCTVHRNVRGAGYLGAVVNYIHSTDIESISE